MTSNLNRRGFLRMAGVAVAGGAFELGAARDPMWAAHPRGGRLKRIVILGAGMSGLAAGLELRKAGHEVILLEARARPGGRVYTIREPFSDGLYAEAGASRIPITHRLTLEYIKRFRLKVDPFYPSNGGEVFLWRGRRVQVAYGKDPNTDDFNVDFNGRERQAGFGGLEKLYFEPVQREIRALAFDGWPQPSLAAYGKVSLRDHLKTKGASNDAIQFLSQGFEEDSALDFLHDSVSHAVPRLWKIRGGNDLLPRAMAAELRAQIRYGAEVVRIEQSDNSIRVKFTTGPMESEVGGDYLICTLPFPVLRAIEARPAWSAGKQYAIQNVYLGPVARVFVQTRERFWEKQGLNGFATVDRPMEVWSPTFNQPGTRGLVLSYIYEKMAREYSALSVSDQVEKTLELYEQIYPGMRDQFETATTWAWSNEKYTRGAFLVTRPGDFDTILPHVGTPEGRIHFAGEHTSPWPGWMQGALHSGLRAAREVTAAV